MMIGAAVSGRLAGRMTAQRTVRLGYLILFSGVATDLLYHKLAPLLIANPWKRWLISQTVAIPASLKIAPQALGFIFGPQPAPADSHGAPWQAEQGCLVVRERYHPRAPRRCRCDLPGRAGDEDVGDLAPRCHRESRRRA